LKLRQGMRVELKNLQQKTGITFIFVTHDQEEALTMSDRIAVMDQGRIQQLGNPLEIYEQPVNRFVADFIGDTKFVRARVIRLAAGARAASSSTVPRSRTRMTVGRSRWRSGRKKSGWPKPTATRRAQSPRQPMSAPIRVTRSNWPTVHRSKCGSRTRSTAMRGS